MDTYKRSLPSMRFSGPTLLAPVLRNTIAFIKQELSGSLNPKYFVLLVLTDGDINDMQQTIDQIVEASHTLPLSIVLVGIGNGPFDNMNKLDADEVPLIDNKKRKMLDDIVQFVEYREVQNHENALAKEVLEEIPR